MLTGGNNGPLGGVVPGGPDMTVPEFSFTVAKAVPIATAQNADPKKYAAAAKGAARSANDVIDSLYTQAFLDPANWRRSSYDDAFAAFDQTATDQAQRQLPVLTAGEGAGDTYTSIAPSHSTLKTRVLMDEKGRPASIVAIVRFKADGKHKDGSTTVFVSEGQYFLRQIDGAWKVTAFQVKRLDQTHAPKPVTASPSGSPS